MPLERRADQNCASGAGPPGGALHEPVSRPGFAIMKSHDSLQLHPIQKRALHAATLLLWISGALWLALAEGHDARPRWMKIHGAAAMGFLMVFGTLLLRHVPIGWKKKRERLSGG